MDRIEKHLDQKKASLERLPKGVILAHERIKQNTELYYGNGYKIDIREFVSLYGREQVIADQKKVVGLQKKFEDSKTEPWERNAKIMSDVLETILVDEAELSNWFGESVTTRKTTGYDDLINGVDMVAEFIQESQTGTDVLALGIDVTFGKNTAQKKLERIKDNIDQSRMGTIKYYQDSYANFTGRLDNVPQFIIGVDKEIINQLAIFWVNKDRKALANHPVQVILLQEILFQAEHFAEYSRKNNHPKAESAYKNVANIISNILETKQHIDIQGYEHNQVSQELKRETETIFGQ